MYRMKLALFVSFVATLFAAPVSPLFAQDRPRIPVNCGAPGTRLQTFLDSVPVGAVLRITGSCANGPFVITRDVKLIGGLNATLSAPTNTSPVLVIGEGARVEMQDMRINAEGVGEGIHLLNGSTLVAGRITVESALGVALNVTENSTLQLTESSLLHSDTGLSMIDNSHATIWGSFINDHTTFGVALDKASTADIRDTQMTRNGREENAGAGLYVEALAHATIAGNTISHNFIGIRMEFGYAGLQLGGGDTIEENVATDVACEATVFIRVSQTEFSHTKQTSIDPGCIVRGEPIFLP